MYRKAAERLHEDADLHSEIADFVLTELPGFRCGHMCTLGVLWHAL